jgi:hypothetical protein
VDRRQDPALPAVRQCIFCNKPSTRGCQDSMMEFCRSSTTQYPFYLRRRGVRILDRMARLRVEAAAIVAYEEDEKASCRGGSR